MTLPEDAVKCCPSPRRITTLRRIEPGANTCFLLLITFLLTCCSATQSTALKAGPVYHVFIKYPTWMSGGYLREASDETITLSSLILPQTSSLNDFFVYFFHHPERSTIYFAIIAASNHKWLVHRGTRTRRHSPAVFAKDNSPFLSPSDQRLFSCYKSICDQKGAIAQIPGTNLYVNGEMRRGASLSFDRLNYLTFLPARSHLTPPPQVHLSYDWSLPKNLILRPSRGDNSFT